MGSVNKPALKEEQEPYKFQLYKVKHHISTRTADVENPIPRSGHRIVAERNFFYSFGGFNPNLGAEGHDATLFKEIWKFNMATNQWHNLTQYSPSLPRELASNAVIINDNVMIVHGGTGVPFGITCSNRTYFSNLRKPDSLTLLETSGTPPPPQYGQAMVLSGKYLYVVGGTSGFEFSADVYRLDLKSGVWEAKYVCRGRNEEPQGRYRHEVALFKDRIIIFGGGTVDKAFGFQQLHAFNIITKTWELLDTKPDLRGGGSEDQPGFPLPRRCHGSVQIQEDRLQPPEFMICGGYDGIHIFSDIWKINLYTLQWTCCQHELVSPLYFHSTCLSPNGQMIIFGGISQYCNDENEVVSIRVNDVYSAWVKIPRLTEMCWDAMLFYNPNLVSYPKSKLLDCGVPSEFVERIP